MAEKKKYNSILISGRKDETLTYSKYVKDEESGESVKESLDKKVNVTDELTTQQIKDGAITNEKMAADSVNTEQVIDESIVNSKLANDSVSTEKIENGSVTNDKMAADSVGNINLQDGSVSNEKLEDGSITNEKLAVNSITKDKLKDRTIGVEKLDNELRQTIAAATGLPEELVESIQNVDENLAKLNDTVYPITLGFSLTPNVGTMQTEIRYSVSSDNKPLMPDTSIISKQINDNAPKNLSDTPSSGGTLSTPIEGAREIFKFEVGKNGRTGKIATQTRYLCYHGGNSAATITAEILNTLNKVSATGVSFNPKVTTKDNDYIWLVVPSYLSITRVTSAGFDVTLAAPQTVTNSLGSFKAYRTANPLTAATWNLVIS